MNKRWSSWLLIWMPHTVGAVAYATVMAALLHLGSTRVLGVPSSTGLVAAFTLGELVQCFGWFALLRFCFDRYPTGLSGRQLLEKVAAACGGVSLGWGVLSSLLLFAWTRAFGLQLEPAPQLGMAVVLGMLLLVFVVNAAWITSLWSAIHWARRSIQETSIRREQEAKARALAHQAQLQMLRYQLNPHFLFNALNSVRALVHEDPSRAERMIDDLADLLRYSLSRSGAADVTLREEVEAARSYLGLEAVRFEERLRIQWSLQEAALDCLVPGFLLNPLVENAVKYGMETSPGAAVSGEISLRRQEERLELVVANSGRWLPPGSTVCGTGTGLSNVRARLEQRFPGRFELSTRELSGRVEVRLGLPVQSVPVREDAA